MIESTPPLPRFERTLIRAMLAGVSLSASLLALGLVLRLSSNDTSGAATVLNAGLIVLMATPVLRVVLSVAEAVRQRDWFWFWTTVAVAAVLTGTLVYSLRTLR